MKTLLLSLFVLNLTVFGCEFGNKSKTTTPETEATSVITTQTSVSSFEWNGTYQGVIPCADCPGIETKLTLNPDKTYELSVLYQDRDKKPTITKGNFSFDVTGNIIILDKSGNETSYQVKEGSLAMLNRDKKEIEGALKANYVLHKIGK